MTLKAVTSWWETTINYKEGERYKQGSEKGTTRKLEGEGEGENVTEENKSLMGLYGFVWKRERESAWVELGLIW